MTEGRERPATHPRRIGSVAPPPASAVLDTAHLGDIEGAFGRISVGETEHARTWKTRLLTLLAIVGPGIIVMVGDNDAGGVATYAQAGQNYGYSLLWVLVLLVPVLIVNQEMVVRLGAVTGVGHARLINERFGRGWGWFSVGDLFLLNFLTIVTEFIGISLAAQYIGISKYVVVPVSAVALVAIMASGSFRRWERAMFVFIAVTLLQIPMLLMSHPQWGHAAKSLVMPSISGGVSSDAVLLIIAIVGTTVAPWQLFFQQSNVVDKRITPRFIGYERADTVLGAFVVVIGAAALVMTGEWAARSTNTVGGFIDAGATAHLLGEHTGTLGSIFAIVLMDASIIGAAAVTLATSYAFGDVFGLKHSLHRGFADAKQFYLSYTAMVALAAAIVLIPGAPLGLITTAVQALAGLLLPSASVFLLLLCNDREVLGPWVNRSWLNWVAGLIVGTLLLLSGILMATTLFPSLDVVTVAGYLALSLVVLAAAAAPALRWLTRRQPAPPAARLPVRGVDRNAWRMPPLTLLEPVTWSAGTRLAMIALRAYLVIGAAAIGGQGNTTQPLSCSLTGHLAVPLETLWIAHRVVKDEPRGLPGIFLAQRVGQPVPRRLGGKDGDMLVADLGGHAGKVPGLLLLTNPGGCALEPGLVPDERVVGCAAVEGHAGPHHFPLLVTLFVAVADDGHHRHDHRKVRRRPSRLSRSFGDVRQDVPGDIARLADRMHVHPVGHFARHPQHPRIDRCDIDFRIWRLDGTRAPLRGDEIEVVEVAVVIERPGSKRREARLDGEQVVAQPRTRPLERDAVAPDDVGAHLGAQTQPEIPASCLLKLPGRGRRDERTAREGHRDPRGQLEAGSGLRRHGGVQVGRTARLGEQQTGEPRGLRTPGQVADLVERLRDRHRVDVHGPEPIRPLLGHHRTVLAR